MKFRTNELWRVVERRLEDSAPMESDCWYTSYAEAQLVATALTNATVQSLSDCIIECERRAAHEATDEG